MLILQSVCVGMICQMTARVRWKPSWIGRCLAPVASILIAPPAALAQTAGPPLYRDPYTAGPTRPLDGSLRTNYARPADAVSAEAPQPAIWNGFYLGAQLGYRWANTSADAPGLAAAKTTGAQFGGHIGTNYQAGPVVFGFEGDLMLGGASSNSTAGGASVAARESWTSTLRARAGVAFGPALIYATGGLALADQNLTASTGSMAAQLAQMRVGTVLGAGFEYKFAPQVSARIEALHTSYKDAHVPWAAGATAIKQDSTAVRGGLTFHFN